MFNFNFKNSNIYKTNNELRSIIIKKKSKIQKNTHKYKKSKMFNFYFELIF